MSSGYWVACHLPWRSCSQRWGERLQGGHSGRKPLLSRSNGLQLGGNAVGVYGALQLLAWLFACLVPVGGGLLPFALLLVQSVRLGGLGWS